MQVKKYLFCEGQQRSFAVPFIALFLIFTMANLSAAAQVLYGSLTGNVTDPTGAVVPAAAVQAVEANKGITQQATSDSSGVYRFSDLLPGTWKITVKAKGFNTAVTENIQVDANTVVRVDEKLATASVTETVTVAAAPPELQTDRADVHTDLTTEELQSLPAIASEGKNFQGLLKVVPGASLPAENNSAAANPNRAMTSNVNGQSSQGNSTRIDGVLDLDPWLPNNIAYVPPTDAIATVNIATSSFDAEQGMANGAVVNVQIKSGTNKFHGDLHEFHTDDGLKNKNYFNPPGYRKPLNVFNQFGGAIGGPILKDKLFFFADVESTRQVQSPSGGNPQTVPVGTLSYATAMANGYFDFTGLSLDKTGTAVHVYDPRTGDTLGENRQPIMCNGVMDRICVSDVDPAALKMAALVGKLVSSSLGVVVPGTTNNFLDLQKGKYDRTNYDGKINYVPTQKTQIFGHYSMTLGKIYDPPALGPAGGGATNGGQPGNAKTDIYVIGFGGTHTFTPNLLLDANAGFTRQHIAATDTDIAADGAYGLDTLDIPGTNNSQDPSNPLYFGLPSFAYTTFTTLGNSTGSNPFTFRDNQYSGNVNLTWIKHHHQIRFGFEDLHTQLNHFQPQGSFQTARGIFQFDGIATEQIGCTGTTCTTVDPPKSNQFDSYADFLLGLPYQDGKEVLTLDPIALRWTQYAMYARDQWQVTPTLSVDLGVRYEIYPFAYSDHGGGARVLNPATMQVLIGGHGGVPQNDGVTTGHGLLLPRLGIAWRPDTKTVVRSGFGISADSNNWRVLRNDYPAAIGTAWNGTLTGGSVNYNQFAPASSLTGANAGPYNVPTGIVLATLPNISSGSIPLPNGIGTNTIPLNFRRGYIYSYNLTLEREFAGFVADLGYVGAREVRPMTQMNLNYSPLGGGAAGRVLNAKFGGNWPDLQEFIPMFDSSYNSLQTKLTRNFGRASTLGVIYTWSKSIDYDDNDENGTLLWSAPSLLHLNRGLAGWDRTHNFEAYAVYALPFGRDQRWLKHGVGGLLAGGWKISGVLSALSGTPFSVTDSGDTGTLNSPDEQAVPNIVAPIQITNGKPHQSPGSCSTVACEYFNPASFERVTTAGVLGNSGRNIIRGPGYFDLDATLNRDFKITERYTFQIEASAIGLTNTPHFSNPTADLNSSNFGKVTGTVATSNASLGGSGGERLFYFGGKIIF
jgi:hypothetical protein